MTDAYFECQNCGTLNIGDLKNIKFGIVQCEECFKSMKIKSTLTRLIVEMKGKLDTEVLTYALR